MLISYKLGQGSIILRVKVLNSSVATGAGLTGLTSGSSGLIISTIADNEASATAYTQAGSTIESITTLGTFAAPTSTKCRFKEVDATNHKGVYEIQIADARFAVSSAKSILVSISGATNAAETDALVPLVSLDPYSATVTLAAASVQAIWDALTSALTTAGSIGKRLVDYLTGDIYARLGSPAGASTAADIAAIKAVLPSALVSGRIDASVGGYQTGQAPLQPTTAGRTLDVAATGEAGLDFDNIKDATGAHTLTNIRVPNVTLADTVTTYTGDTPQTGDSFARIGAAGAGLTAVGDTAGTTTLLSRLTAARAGYLDVLNGIVAAIWAAVTDSSGVTTLLARLTSTRAGLLDNLDATISSRTKPADTQAAVTTVANLTNAPTAGDFTAAMKTSLNNATPAVTVSDKTGFSLVSGYDPAKTASQSGDAMALTSGERTTLAGVIWDRLTFAITTAGSIGKLIKDNLDAAVSSRSTYDGSDTSGTTTLLSRLSAARAGYLDVLNGIVAAIWAAVTDSSGVATLLGRLTSGRAANLDNLDAAISSRSTYAGTDTSGTTTLLARLTSVRAGNLDHLDADVSSRLITSGYTAPDNAGIAAIEAKTNNLPASPAATGDIPTAAENADGLLGRNIAGGSDGGRDVTSAMRALRNRVDTNSVPGSLVVMEEDDTTEAWRATLTTDSAADPIVRVDPT